MNGKIYLLWFFGVVVLALSGIVSFNVIADAYILNHRALGGIQTVSGFERVLKPAWLDSIQPDLVFVGSSRVREGFDTALIDAAFGTRSFNYGVSSITPYEARRYVQDAIALPSVKTMVIGMDAFAGGNEAQKTGAGFDELRLSVQADGTKTPRRRLWLLTTRALSGGVLGMHALSLYYLAQLKPNETARDRPDLFVAYSQMTQVRMRQDLAHRYQQKMILSSWGHSQFRAALAATCSRAARIFLFFPPDRSEVLARYAANDSVGTAAFKKAIFADVVSHNALCKSKVSLFDFLNRNALTDEELKNGRSPSYIDLIHFRPTVGLRLLRRMMQPQSVRGDSALSKDMLTGPHIGLARVAG